MLFRSLAGADTAQAGSSGTATPETVTAQASPAPPAQLGDIGRMLAHIADAHAQRMSSLGLSA